MVVSRMDIQQLLAMWEVLAELEGVRARLAAERMSAMALQELEAVHRAAEPSVEAEDIVAWQDHNRAFHEVLYRDFANPCLRDAILKTRSRISA